VTFKEVRLTPKIGSGDFETKVHRAIEFLEDGDRIKVTVRFRGRELTHPELGRNMLTRFTERVKDHGTPERAPLLEGKSMHITMASLHKPKEHVPTARGDGAHAPETEAADVAATEPVATIEPPASEPAPKPVVAEAPAVEPEPEPVAEPEPEPAPVAAPAAKRKTETAPAPEPVTTGE